MRRLSNHWWRVLGAAIVIQLLRLNLLAGTFIVNPVRIDVSAARPNAVMQIENMSSDAVTLQVHVVTWSSQGAVDQYADTDEILLNPPIFSLEPHQKQFLRLGLRHGNSGALERTYRLILEEVPAPPKPGFSGLTTILKISVPIFSSPGTKVAPRVSWHAERTATGVKIVGINSGSAHLQLRHFELRDTAHKDAALSRILTDYLLPGQTKAWDFDDEHLLQSGEIAFRAETDAGEVREELVPQHP